MIEGFRQKLEEVKMLSYKALRRLHFTDLSFMYTPSIIAFGALAYAFQVTFQEEILLREDIVTALKKQNVFDYSFWERGAGNEDEARVDKVRLYIGKIIDKEPSISIIKTYKKIIKGIHHQVPNYLEDMEKKRKEKEVVPEDFLSDEEIKEAMPPEFLSDFPAEFKPPKPIKPGKRTLSVSKPNDATNMKVDSKSDLKEYPEDMMITLTINEDDDKE